MTDDGDFLRRWSRRKVAAKTASPAGAARPLADAAPAKVGAQHPEPTKTPPVEQALPLPPVESLTIESDFTPFMQPGVDPALKRQALRTLVRDPRFNVMDGLDIYIGDYSIPDPMPPEWLGQLKQLERLGHYIEPEEKPVEGAPKEEQPALGGPAGEAQKAMHEQPVTFPEEAPPADTASKDSPESR
jgi:hypothetical protein